jgi:hypothetical protein
MDAANKSSVSRRNFLKGGIVLATGALGAYALSGCTDQNAVKIDESQVPTVAPPKEVSLYRGYYAGHGDKCFTQAVVAVDADGLIVALNIDDYQYLDKTTEGITPLPNATRGLSAGNIDTMWLASKRANDAYYSTNMAEKGEATQGWLESMSAVEAYAIGKKPSELASVELDAVSGSTLEDTPGYLAGVNQIVKDAIHVSKGSFDVEGAELKLGVVNVAAHGANSFTNSAALVQGETLVCANIDEFQYMDGTNPEVIGVPNSAGAFGTTNYVPGRVLGSKIINDKTYSKNMAEKGEATQGWLESITAIEENLIGGKISEFSVSEFDTVSGATLSDTPNYSKSALTAAVEAWWV